MRYRLQRHDGTDCSATMVPITVLRMVPIQRYRHYHLLLINQKVMNGLFPLMQEWMILLLKVSNEQEILMSVFGKKELGKKEMDTFPSPQSF